MVKLKKGGKNKSSEKLELFCCYYCCFSRKDGEKIWFFGGGIWEVYDYFLIKPHFTVIFKTKFEKIFDF